MRKQSVLRLSRLLSLTFILSCCAATGGAPRAIEPGVPATLAPNETVNVRGTSLEVQFLAIATDSRCPRDATCVWAGRVIARFSIRDDEHTATHEVPATETIALGTRRLTVESVQPERLTEGKIPERDYRVTIRID
jgi:hypothetical protein